MRAAPFLLVLLAACSEPKGPAPAPAPPPPSRELPRIDFGAYGDCRSGHDVHRAICASLAAMKPRFVAVSGDLVDWGDDEGDWETFRGIVRELRAATEYLPAPGNHDVSSQRNFEREFRLERPYYDRRLGEIHVFLLDSNDSFQDAPQLRWLEETASASDAKHKFAVFHHSPWTVDPYGEHGTRMIRDRIHGLLVRLRFCAAFCGHHHAFYTTRRDGLRYVVTAGGGAPLYEIDPSKAIPGDLFRKFHHFVGCAVSDRGISARVFEPDGREVPELAFPVCQHP